jgi:hypothetical protein
MLTVFFLYYFKPFNPTFIPNFCRYLVYCCGFSRCPGWFYSWWLAFVVPYFCKTKLCIAYASAVSSGCPQWGCLLNAFIDGYFSLSFSLSTDQGVHWIFRWWGKSLLCIVRQRKIQWTPWSVDREKLREKYPSMKAFSKQPHWGQPLDTADA